MLKLAKADCSVTKGQRWCDGNKSIDNAVVPMAMVVLVRVREWILKEKEEKKNSPS